MTDAEGLRNRVENWINKTGIGLEHQVRDVAARHGFESTLGDHVESDAGPLREVDIIMWNFPDMRKLPDESRFSVRLMCECKFLSKPWTVVLGNKQDRSEIFGIVSTPMTTRAGELLFPKSGGRKVTEVVKNTARFGGERSVGYRVLEAFSEPGKLDRPFGLLQKLTELSGRYLESRLADSAASILIPLIVVEGSLFVGNYENGSSGISVRPTSTCQVLWRGGGENVLIDIVERDALDGYFSSLLIDVSLISGIIEGNIVNEINKLDM